MDSAFDEMEIILPLLRGIAELYYEKRIWWDMPCNISILVCILVSVNNKKPYFYSSDEEKCSFLESLFMIPSAESDDRFSIPKPLAKDSQKEDKAMRKKMVSFLTCRSRQLANFYFFFRNLKLSS